MPHTRPAYELGHRSLALHAAMPHTRPAYELGRRSLAHRPHHAIHRLHHSPTATTARKPRQLRRHLLTQHLLLVLTAGHQ